LIVPLDPDVRKETARPNTAGIINCHGALLPKYRGLMPSFLTLKQWGNEGGVSVHFIDKH
jgi:methionyl-tRNA formyltransferase